MLHGILETGCDNLPNSQSSCITKEPTDLQPINSKVQDALHNLLHIRCEHYQLSLRGLLYFYIFQHETDCYTNLTWKIRMFLVYVIVIVGSYLRKIRNLKHYMHSYTRENITLSRLSYS